MAKRTVSYEDRQEIIAQALEEIAFARQHKQGKIKRTWQPNEDLYYSRGQYNDFYYTNGVTQTPLQQTSRANVDLGQMAAFVHTILAKIDNPLIFKFVKRKLAQMKRVKMLNALRVADQDKDDWEIKDLVGKKQAIIYGRAIYSYYADSVNGYRAHLDNVDVYDFLIDPSAGGIDIERAMYLGNYGVVKTRQEIKAGIKSGIYLRTEANELLGGDGNSIEEPQEEINKKRRTQDQNVWTTQKEIGNKDKFKFWNWGTTWEGQRYYLLLSETGATAIEVVPIEEKFESALWWYWTWAAFPDLTEFWTPAFCDYVRQIFLAQAVSVNQLLDNAEQINKPQKIVNITMIENLSEIKYRREGLIKVKKEFDVNKAYKSVETPSIQTPIQVFELLDGIKDKSSGVTAGDQGDAKNNGDAKATIYQGNQANSADRFGYLNRSYAFGYKRFAKLWENGVREHLVKKIAIDILGPDGVDIVEASRRDIFRKDESFNVMVEASNAEIALDDQDKETKLGFLAAQAAIPVAPGAKPIMNAQKAFEIQAEIAGFSAEAIRELLDNSNYGDAELMAAAERDIEQILDGEMVPPNEEANTAYKQRVVDYMTEHKVDIDMDQFTALANYVMSLDAIIMRNMVRQANDELMKMKMAQIAATGTQPLVPPVVTKGNKKPAVGPAAPAPASTLPASPAPQPPSALPQQQ